MTDPTAIPPDPSPPAGFPAEDFLSDAWQFDTTVWHDAPEFTSDDTADTKLVARRNAHHAAYRLTGTATTWLRYLTLGYYAFDDAALFDREWSKWSTDPTNIHRIIFYNYLYHVDRDIQIPPKLDLWATKISHAHLLQYDPDSTGVNTIYYSWPAWLNWKHNTPSDRMDIDDQSDWNLVRPRGQSREKQTNATSPTMQSVPTQLKSSNDPPMSQPNPNKNQLTHASAPRPSMTIAQDRKSVV